MVCVVRHFDKDFGEFVELYKAHDFFLPSAGSKFEFFLTDEVNAKKSHSFYSKISLEDRRSLPPSPISSVRTSSQIPLTLLECDRLVTNESLPLATEPSESQLSIATSRDFFCDTTQASMDGGQSVPDYSHEDEFRAQSLTVEAVAQVRKNHLKRDTEPLPSALTELNLIDILIISNNQDVIAVDKDSATDQQRQKFLNIMATHLAVNCADQYHPTASERRRFALRFCTEFPNLGFNLAELTNTQGRGSFDNKCLTVYKRNKRHGLTNSSKTPTSKKRREEVAGELTKEEAEDALARIQYGTVYGEELRDLFIKTRAYRYDYIKGVTDERGTATMVLANHRILAERNDFVKIDYEFLVQLEYPRSQLRDFASLWESTYAPRLLSLALCEKYRKWMGAYGVPISAAVLESGDIGQMEKSEIPLLGFLAMFPLLHGRGQKADKCASENIFIDFKGSYDCAEVLEEIRRRKLTQLVLVKLGAGMGKYYVRVDDDLVEVKGNFTAGLQLLIQLHFVLRLNYDTRCLGAFRIFEHCYGLETKLKYSMNSVYVQLFDERKGCIVKKERIALEVDETLQGLIATFFSRFEKEQNMVCVVRSFDKDFGEFVELYESHDSFLPSAGSKFEFFLTDEVNAKKAHSFFTKISLEDRCSLPTSLIQSARTPSHIPLALPKCEIFVTSESLPPAAEQRESQLSCTMKEDLLCETYSSQASTDGRQSVPAYSNEEDFRTESLAAVRKKQFECDPEPPSTSLNELNLMEILIKSNNQDLITVEKGSATDKHRQKLLNIMANHLAVNCAKQYHPTASERRRFAHRFCTEFPNLSFNLAELTNTQGRGSFDNKCLTVYKRNKRDGLTSSNKRPMKRLKAKDSLAQNSPIEMKFDINNHE
uniref:R3H domain-containing protein n=1 Tax=Plectus sambesii TaxID=2011161 RepID=A0A914X728_9BILA